MKRSEDEEKVRRRREQMGGEERRGEETKRRAPRIRSRRGKGVSDRAVVQQRNARRSIRAADIKQGV